MTQSDGSPRDDDELWRSIVDHYGDRPDLSEPGEPQPETPASGAVPDGEVVGEPDDEPPDDPEDRFVPPPTPPVPIPQGARLAAWVGIFAVPPFLLLSVVFEVSVPRLVAYAVLAWFLGGFGYLVAAMPRGPREPWDDGAQV